MEKLQLKTKNLLILAILFFLPVYLIKIKLGWVSFNAVELLIMILFLVWIFNKQKKYLIPYTRYFIPIILIFAGLCLSVVANKNYYSGFGVIKGWFVFPIIFAIIFYDQLRKDENLLGKSLLALFFSAAVISVIGLVYKFLGVLTYDGRLKTFWDSPNQLAMFLAVPFLIGIFFMEHGTWNMEQNKFNDRFLILGGGMMLIVANLYFTKSFGAWIGIFVALFVMFWLKYREKTSKKYWVINAIVLTIFLVLIGVSKFEQIKNISERSSLASREMIWKSAGLMIKNNSLFGIGPGNFQNKYLEYQKYFPSYLEWSAPQPHNIFLAFWLESGLIGLSGFIWVLLLFFRDNKKAVRRTSDRELGILFLVIMIYILIHGLVDTTYWRNDLAVVFWVVIVANLYSAGGIKAD